MRRISLDVAAASAAPDTGRRIADLGFTTETLSPQELGDMVESERGRWGALVEEAGIGVE